jgi:small-conductance mechanosensitive channel
MITAIDAVIRSLLVGISIITVAELLRTACTRAARRAGAEPVVIRDMGEGFRIVAAVAVVSAILSVTGLATEFTALTMSGIAALVVSLALQTTLSNIIAGMLLFSDGAIRLHDQVEFGGIKGKVERLASRNTWIKTESGAVVIVSNSNLSNGPLINHSATERLSKRYAIR